MPQNVLLWQLQLPLAEPSAIMLELTFFGKLVDSMCLAAERILSKLMPEQRSPRLWHLHLIGMW